jgi:hypothetical protein
MLRAALGTGASSLGQRLRSSGPCSSKSGPQRVSVGWKVCTATRIRMNDFEIDVACEGPEPEEAD